MSSKPTDEQRRRARATMLFEARLRQAIGAPLSAAQQRVVDGEEPDEPADMESLLRAAIGQASKEDED